MVCIWCIMLMISKTRGGVGLIQLLFLEKNVATMRKMVNGKPNRDNLNSGDDWTYTWNYERLPPNKVISSLTSRFDLEIETTALRILNSLQWLAETTHHKKNSKSVSENGIMGIRKNLVSLKKKWRNIYSEDMDIHGEVPYKYLVGSTVN